MSSRNVFLTPSERNAAPAISRGLHAAAALFEAGERDAAKLAAAVNERYSKEPLIKTEYVEIVSLQTLQPQTVITGAALLAVACRTTESGTRLIDNIVIGGSW
jgi:pantoate--beta-alanine ligase